MFSCLSLTNVAFVFDIIPWYLNAFYTSQYPAWGSEYIRINEFAGEHLLTKQDWKHLCVQPSLSLSIGISYQHMACSLMQKHVKPRNIVQASRLFLKL